MIDFALVMARTESRHCNNTDPDDRDRFLDVRKLPQLFRGRWAVEEITCVSVFLRDGIPARKQHQTQQKPARANIRRCKHGRAEKLWHDAGDFPASLKLGYPRSSHRTPGE